MELLIPGAMVNARVRAVLKDGLLLSFLTYFMGTVSSQFLLSPLLLFCFFDNISCDTACV